MCLHPTNPASPRPDPPPCPAKTLSPQQRQELAVKALAGGQPIADLARQAGVSRKFVYQLKAIAQRALHDAFHPQPAATDPSVLFWLPVTQPWLEQLVLGLVFLCHSSFRGVVELLADVFDYSLSLGSVCNIVHDQVPLARQINGQQDLANVHYAAPDEIFQASDPILVGIDVKTTYCYLLSKEEQRDGDTWAIHLFDLQARHFDPQATIADGGSGLRAGQQLALPDTPCRFDVFHLLYEVQPLVTYLDNRAYDAIEARSKLQRKQATSRRRTSRSNRSVAGKLVQARKAEADAIALASDVSVLVRWLQQDILALAGPDHATRVELYNFVVAELRARQPLCEHRIRPVCTLLENQRDALLAFAAQLDQDLAQVGQEFAVSLEVVRQVLAVQSLSERDRRRWVGQERLWQQVSSRYHGLSQAVAAVAAAVVRASSVVENFNSRLRNYFFLRRQLGGDYLALLQFFLNHHRFVRSAHVERVGKSPAELLSGERHRHWLELLGYQRFCRQGQRRKGRRNNQRQGGATRLPPWSAPQA